MHLLYSISLKKLVLISGVFFVLCILFTKTTHASSLSSASATLSTSRPSASSPISADAALGVGQLSIFSNGSRYLASDSAQVVRGTGIVSNNPVKIASQSSAFTTVYLSGTLGTGVGAGADVLYVPITAMHTIGFTANTTIPSGGKIVISYPGTFSNSASPSATTFAFNALSTGNVKSFPASACNTVTISSSGTPTVTCTTNAIEAAGTNIQIYIGCTTATAVGCTVQAPTLINPTKAATAGTADIWKVGIQTQDVSSVTLDNSTVAIGTIETVTVRATIDPSLTFSIAGINSGTAVNNSNGGCGQSELTNSGIDSTATEVGLGVLSIAPAVDTKLNNIAAQRLTVTTNGANGYSITATSPGSLINPSTGFFLNSNTSPQVFPQTGHFFGLHACGADTDLVRWNTTGLSACNTYDGTAGSANICKYAWPTYTAPMLIAQDTSGPIGNGVPTGNGIVSVSYAATQDVTLPPGQYQTVITYVATPSF